MSFIVGSRLKTKMEFVSVEPILRSTIDDDDYVKYLKSHSDLRSLIELGITDERKRLYFLQYQKYKKYLSLKEYDKEIISTLTLLQQPTLIFLRESRDSEEYIIIKNPTFVSRDFPKLYIGIMTITTTYKVGKDTNDSSVTSEITHIDIKDRETNVISFSQNLCNEMTQFGLAILKLQGLDLTQFNDSERFNDTNFEVTNIQIHGKTRTHKIQNSFVYCGLYEVHKWLRFSNKNVNLSVRASASKISLKLYNKPIDFTLHI